MNRSNSIVSSLKWWPLQGQSINSTAQTHNGNGGVLISPPVQHHKAATFGSSVAVQKLRESKWFKRDEQRIFCAVVECGFIVELRNSIPISVPTCKSHKNHGANNDDDDDDDDDLYADELLQDENKAPQNSWFGVVLCKTAKDRKPKPETIEIFTIKIRESGMFKMIRLSLDDIWKNGWELRINNFSDKEKTPHNEKDIRNQVSFARKAKQSLWNNNKHFAYWCRYGSRQQDVRKRQMSECVKWGTVGMNAGMLLVMKQKSYSTSK